MPSPAPPGIPVIRIPGRPRSAAAAGIVSQMIHTGSLLKNWYFLLWRNAGSIDVTGGRCRTVFPVSRFLLGCDTATLLLQISGMANSSPRHSVRFPALLDAVFSLPAHRPPTKLLSFPVRIMGRVRCYDESGPHLWPGWTHFVAKFNVTSPDQPGSVWISITSLPHFVAFILPLSQANVNDLLHFRRSAQR